MNAQSSASTDAGRVEAIYFHPQTAGASMVSVAEGELVVGRGLSGDPRYFTRESENGAALRRQVTLMGREELAGHAVSLGLKSLPAGCVRANLETSGIDWRGYVGKQVRVGEALIEIQELRTPCAKMDAVTPGLRAAMADGRQGVIASVVRSGRVRVGDTVRMAG